MWEVVGPGVKDKFNLQTQSWRIFHESRDTTPSTVSLLWPSLTTKLEPDLSYKGPFFFFFLVRLRLRPRSLLEDPLLSVYKGLVLHTPQLLSSLAHITSDSESSLVSKCLRDLRVLEDVLALPPSVPTLLQRSETEQVDLLESRGRPRVLLTLESSQTSLVVRNDFQKRHGPWSTSSNSFCLGRYSYIGVCRVTLSRSWRSDRPRQTIHPDVVGCCPPTYHKESYGLKTELNAIIIVIYRRV